MNKLFSRDYFRDRPILLLGATGVFLSLINILYVLINVKRRDFDIPVRFTQYANSSIELGDWFSFYDLALFAVVTAVTNVLLSMKLHSLRRSISLIILTLHILVMVVLFLVSRALFGLSPSS